MHGKGWGTKAKRLKKPHHKRMGMKAKTKRPTTEAAKDVMRRRTNRALALLALKTEIPLASMDWDNRNFKVNL